MSAQNRKYIMRADLCGNTRSCTDGHRCSMLFHQPKQTSSNHVWQVAQRGATNPTADLAIHVDMCKTHIMNMQYCWIRKDASVCFWVWKGRQRAQQHVSLWLDTAYGNSTCPIKRNGCSIEKKHYYAPGFPNVTSTETMYRNNKHACTRWGPMQ